MVIGCFESTKHVTIFHQTPTSYPTNSKTFYSNQRDTKSSFSQVYSRKTCTKRRFDASQSYDDNFVGTRDFASPLESFCSPLARSIFQLDNVKGVFFSTDYITVTKSPDTHWGDLKANITQVIMNFYASGQPIIDEKAEKPKDTEISEDDDEVVIAIKELLDTKIRPLVQDDGGDLKFEKFENGIVHLRLHGACKSCNSSSITLKGYVENMLKHYIPEVESVEQVDERVDETA